MSFYECDECKKACSFCKIDGKAQYEIERLDLKFCSYSCLVKYFKDINLEEE